MKYTKPEVLVSGSGFGAIQSSPAKPNNTIHDHDLVFNGTANAYEADE